MAIPSLAAGPRKLPFWALDRREQQSGGVERADSRVVFRARQAREVDEYRNFTL